MKFNNSIAQEWATVGTTWTYTYEHIFSPEVSYNTIESIGDTILNGQSCRILKPWKPACDLPNYGYDDNFGHIYMYDQNDTVIFYNSEIDDFVVFYDFTAEAGDSWTTMLPESSFQFEFDSFEVFVDSTSVFELAGQNLKALHVRYVVDTGEDEFASTIVEYLGDLESMFSGYLFPASLCDAEYNRGLRCFENDEFGLVNFVDFPCDSTWLISSTAETPKKGVIVNIYPNPSDDNLHIQLPNNAGQRVFEIYDVQQKLRFKKEINTNNLEIEIRTTNYQSGLYFWILKEENKIVKSGKIMVKD